MIQGDITNFPLVDLFQWLAFTRRSGKLLVAQGDRHSEFYFAAGELTVALSETIQTNNRANAQAVFSCVLDDPQGYFIFNDSSLPPEILSLSLRLPIDSLLTEDDRLRRITKAEAEGTDAGDDNSDEGATFTKADELRLEIVGQLLKGDFVVPAMPQLAARVFQLTRNPNCSFRALAELISIDQSITAQALRYANSALLGSKRKIETLPEAVMRLGADEIVNIVLAATVRSSNGADGFVEQRYKLWVRSSTAAFLARSIARHSGLDQNLGFVCGLLMDFGMGVLYSVIGEVSRHLRVSTRTAGDVVKDYHPRVGRLIGEKWRLPEPVVQSMAFHHSPDQATADRQYVALSGLADFLATFATGQPRRFLENSIKDFTADRLVSHPCARMIDLSHNHAATLLQDLPQLLDDSQKFLQ